MRTKHLIIGAALAVAGVAYYGYNYVQRMRHVFDRMQIFLSGVSDVSISAMQLTFKVSFTIQNPTATGFYLTGAKVARLKSIAVYRKGKYLGMAQINLEEIELLPYKSLQINNVPFSISLQSVAENILSVSDFHFEDLTLLAVVDILGTIYTIDNSFTA